MSIEPPAPINDDQIIARDPGMIDAMIGDELVGLHLESGSCYGFNATATRIWAIAAAPVRFGDLCQRLAEEYDVAPDQCRRDCSMLIRTLADDGMMTIAPAR